MVGRNRPSKNKRSSGHAERSGRKGKATIMPMTDAEKIADLYTQLHALQVRVKQMEEDRTWSVGQRKEATIYEEEAILELMKQAPAMLWSANSLFSNKTDDMVSFEPRQVGDRLKSLVNQGKIEEVGDNKRNKQFRLVLDNG